MAGVIRILPILFCLVAPAADGQTPSKEATVKQARECLHKAVDAAQRVEDWPNKWQLMEEIGQDLACVGDFDAARQTVKGANSNRTAMILAAIGIAQAKRGDGDAARTTLAEAMKVNRRLAPDEQLDVLHDILQGHFAAGQFDEAAKIVSESPSPFSRFCAQVDIAEAYLAAGRREAAKDILRQAATILRNGLDNPDLLRHSDVLWPLHLQADDAEAALELARALPKGYWVRCRALSGIGEYYAKKGDVAASRAIFKEALDVARGMEHAGDNLSAPGDEEFETERIVEAHARGGDLDGAAKVLEQMPSGYHKADAYTALATAQAKAGDRAAARAALERAVVMIEGMPRDDNQIFPEESEAQGKVESLALIAECQVEIGERAAAKDTVAKILPWLRRLHPNSVALPSHSVAEVQIRLGDRQAARKTLQDAARMIRGISEADFRVEEATTMAEAQIHLGFHEDALTTLRELALAPSPDMERKSEKETEEDDYGEEDPYASHRDRVAVLFARAGDLRGAYRVVKQIEDADFAVNALRVATACHVMSKGPDEALAIAAEETDPALRSSLWHGVGAALLRSAGIRTPNWWSCVEYVWLWKPEA